MKIHLVFSLDKLGKAANDPLGTRTELNSLKGRPGRVNGKSWLYGYYLHRLTVAIHDISSVKYLVLWHPERNAPKCPVSSNSMTPIRISMSRVPQSDSRISWKLRKRKNIWGTVDHPDDN
jgi:hypothetical protein